MLQTSIKCAIYRGGTSRGLFFHKKDLPTDVAAMKEIFYEAIDCYNPSQIDGLGAATSHTSKIVVIGESTKAGADVNYTFYQMGIGEQLADADGTCGNLMSAVGPFAINEGLVKVDPKETVKKVIIYDTNIDKLIEEYVPVTNGKAQVAGTYQMKGVVRSGAKIRMDIIQPGGGKTGGSLPLGAVCTLQGLDKAYTVTWADIVNPLVLVDMHDLGYTGKEALTILSGDNWFMCNIKYLREQAVVAIGWADSTQQAVEKSPVIPRLAVLSAPLDYTTTSGKTIRAADVDIVAKLLSLNKMHRTFAASGLYCLAASCLMQGTVANKLARPLDSSIEQTVRIGHPDGVVEVRVKLDAHGDVAYVGMDRTARLIMLGEIFVKQD